jgi:membrane protein
MTKLIEDKLEKIPILRILVRFLKRFKLPGLEGLSFYDLIELYVIGIAKGALTARASAIAFSFFTALFPFLLFVLIIIPYIPLKESF